MKSTWIRWVRFYNNCFNLFHSTDFRRCGIFVVVRFKRRLYSSILWPPFRCFGCPWSDIFYNSNKKLMYKNKRNVLVKKLDFFTFHMLIQRWGREFSYQLSRRQNPMHSRNYSKKHWNLPSNSNPFLTTSSSNYVVTSKMNLSWVTLIVDASSGLKTKPYLVDDGFCKVSIWFCEKKKNSRILFGSTLKSAPRSAPSCHVEYRTYRAGRWMKESWEGAPLFCTYTSYEVVHSIKKNIHCLEKA